MKFYWAIVALCALSFGFATGNEAAQPLAVSADIPMQVKEQTIEGQMIQAEETLPIADEIMVATVEKMEGESSKKVIVMDGQATDAVFEEQLAKAAEQVEVLKEPEMQRLARHLRQFHNMQERRNALARSAEDVNDGDDDDDEAIAEERAVRRRKRIRRRNSKNKMKRTHRNKLVSKRRQSQRRRQSNRNSANRKNIKRVKSNRKRNRNNQNVRRTPNRQNSNRRRKKTSMSGKKKYSNRNRSRKGQKKRKQKKNGGTRKLSKPEKMSDDRKPADHADENMSVAVEAA